MPLEEQIVEWAATRPLWQRAILRRVAKGEALTDADYDQLIDVLITSKGTEDADFSLEQLPQIVAGDPPVRLVAVAQPEHVNALESDKPLTFETAGITIVYGDNASGKSGYARLLKRIASSRHRESILSDVFRDTALAGPKAILTVKIGDSETTLPWPDGGLPELQRMRFYDGNCAKAYIATESDFPYRPSALFVMDGLIEACVSIRERIDARLEEIARSAKVLPKVDDDLKETAAGQWLAGLSDSSSLDKLDALIGQVVTSKETIEKLKDQEASLRIADTSKVKLKLSRQADKLDSLCTHLEGIQAVIGNGAIGTLQDTRGLLERLKQAADLLAKSYHSEPLLGVGSSPWRELWESARRYSEEHAYIQRPFPSVGEGDRCVLCQQVLQDEARDRLSRFERFVMNDTQIRLTEAEAMWGKVSRRLADLRTMPDSVETNLQDLDADHANLVDETRELIAKYEVARMCLVDAFLLPDDLPRSGLEPSETISRLKAAAAAARGEAERLSDPEKIKEVLAGIVTRRRELEFLHELKANRQLIADEMGRLKEHGLLEAAKSAAATGPITKKVLELSEESITGIVRDTFTRETDRLCLERVTITKTRAERGALLHQPKLIGARQNVTLPLVFSEGEQTALGLAAYFTEADLDASKSALILDDPVSSLDHIRRGLVAARLAALAEARQVVVFTHDASFVLDIKREASGLGVPVAERSVTRGRGGERKPGACSMKHPWKAKDAPERLGELRSELARMKRDISGWDESGYENEVATWAGKLSETWERIFSQEVVGPILAEGGLEVRPNMVKILVRFSDTDEKEFQASYSRVSQWAKRHDKSAMVNYVAPEISTLEKELARVDEWFKRVRGYKN